MSPRSQFFLTPAIFNHTPVILDFCPLFSSDVPLSKTLSLRETKADVLTAALCCEASVTGRRKVDVSGPTMMADGAVRSSVRQNGTKTEES